MVIMMKKYPVSIESLNENPERIFVINHAIKDVDEYFYDNGILKNELNVYQDVNFSEIWLKGE